MIPNNQDLTKAISDLSNQVNNLQTQINDLKKPVLLFDGNAVAGDNITLSQPYTNFRFLMAIIGTSTTPFFNALMGTTINSQVEEEIYFIKGWANDVFNSQIHIVSCGILSDTEFNVKACMYKVITDNNGVNSTKNASTNNYLKKIYGFY